MAADEPDRTAPRAGRCWARGPQPQRLPPGRSPCGRTATPAPPRSLRPPGAGASPLPASDVARATAPGRPVVPARGPHQAGVLTPPQAHLALVALDLRDGVDREAARGPMRVLTDDVDRLTAGALLTGHRQRAEPGTTTTPTASCAARTATTTARPRR